MTAIDYDAAVASLTRQGIPREKAELAVRKQLRIATPSAAALEDADEEAHVEEGDRLMIALGFEVVRLSQKRRSKVTAGVPDRRYYHRRRRLALWWEAKTETGRQSPAQREFQALAEACGETYVLGKLEVLKQWIVDVGVAYRVGETFEPIPFSIIAMH